METNAPSMKARVYEALDGNSNLTPTELSNMIEGLSKKCAVNYLNLWRRDLRKPLEHETTPEVKDEPVKVSKEPETVDEALNTKRKTKTKAGSSKRNLDNGEAPKVEAKVEKPYQDVIEHVREFHVSMKPVSSICSAARCMLVYFNGPENVPREKEAFQSSGFIGEFRTGGLTGGKAPTDRTVSNMSWYWKKLVDALATYNA